MATTGAPSGEVISAAKAVSSSGQLRAIVAVEAQHLFGLGHRMKDHARQHRADRMEPVLERGDDTEIAAAAAQAPEEVRVLVARWPSETARRP